MTKAHDPTRSAAADALAHKADYGARHAYAIGYEDGLRAAKDDTDDAENYFKCAMEKFYAERARADAAERMVCELRWLLDEARQHNPEEDAGDLWDRIDVALASTAEVAGRWVSADAIGVTLVDGLRAERDAAIATRDEAVARQRADRESLMRDMDRVARDIIAAKRARDEVGLQLAAAQERLRLAGGLRDFAESPPIHWDVSADRQTMVARLDDAVATLSVDGRVVVRRDDGMLLARLDVYEHDGPVSGVLQDRADSQCEIAAALLWSHRRANKLDAVKAWDAVPGDALAPVVKEDEHVVVALADLNTGKWHKLRVFHVLDEAQAYFDELMAELQAAPQPGVFVKINGTLAPKVDAAIEASGINTDNVKEKA